MESHIKDEDLLIEVRIEGTNIEPKYVVCGCTGHTESYRPLVFGQLVKNTPARDAKGHFVKKA